MNFDLVNRIAQAVLYEGYILYPYRRSSVKNRQRWNFGVLYPRDYAEAQSGNDLWRLQTQVLALAATKTTLEVQIRFLQLVNREVGILETPVTTLPAASEISYTKTDSLEIGGEVFQSWQEATERVVRVHCGGVEELTATPRVLRFTFAQARKFEPLSDEGKIAGVIVREHQMIEGEVRVSAERAGNSLFKICVTVSNNAGKGSSERDDALMNSMISAHAVLHLENGDFISLLDPPEEFQRAAAACNNSGSWPVLVGEESERQTMLASPVILYDHPQVAAESAGDLFDGTEIDEILSLRILTLTDEEKREMKSSDQRARQILERTESLTGEQWQKMHGALRR